VSTDRIAIFIPSLRGGGVERVMLNLARGLVDRGRQVDIVLARGEGTFRDHVFEGVNVVDLDSSSVLRSLGRLTGYLRRVRPDVMLAGMGHANLTALWARALSGVRTRIVISIHTLQGAAARRSHHSRDRVIPFLARIFYRTADSIVAVSTDVAHELAETSIAREEDIIVIPNPVVTPELDALSRVPIEHPWYKDADPVVLGVGRLESVKGFDVLMRAFAVLRRKRRAHLIVLGDGSLQADLVALSRELGVQDDTDFLGYAANPFAHMARADVLVVSSRLEGFGNVLVEAMACGTPVISTRCSGGPTEILQGGAIGELVPVDAPDDMANAIGHTLDAPLPPDRLREAARHYSLDTITSRYLEVLDGRS